MMQTHTQLYMQRQPLFPREGARLNALVAIDTEEDAVAAMLERGGAGMVRLYERTEIAIGGEILKGDVRPRDGMLYIGFDDVYDDTGKIAYYDAQQAHYANPQNNTNASMVLRNLFEASTAFYTGADFQAFRQEMVDAQDPQARYVDVQNDFGRFVKLGAHDRVYNGRGARIWPVLLSPDCAPSLIPEI